MQCENWGKKRCETWQDEAVLALGLAKGESLRPLGKLTAGYDGMPCRLKVQDRVRL
jgi:hypothetical protein